MSVYASRETARSQMESAARVTRSGSGLRMRNVMNKNTHPTTRRPVTVVPRETALAGAAAILLEAVMRIETERALSAAKGAAA